MKQMNFWRRKREAGELRQYLLGTLAPSRQENLEQRLLTETAVYEELLATEDELVDKYLTNQLGEIDRKRFESHFAVSEDHQRKIVFGKTFRSYLESISSKYELAVKEKPAFSRRPLIATSIILTMLVMALVLAWSIYKKQTQSSVIKQTLAVTLVSGSNRAEGTSTQRLSRPPTDTVLAVRLEIASNDYQKYRVELFREGQPVTVFDPLTAEPSGGHFVLTVNVDSKLLDAGDYVFKLSGMSPSGSPELKGQYNLRIAP